jgi:hypothetical protein
VTVEIEEVDVVVGPHLPQVEGLVPLEAEDVVDERVETLGDPRRPLALVEVVEALEWVAGGGHLVEVDVLLPGGDQLLGVLDRDPGEGALVGL